MKQKTAMMELIERLENNIQRFDDDPILNRIFKLCANTAKQLLEKEKEQIMKAFNSDGVPPRLFDAEAYYNQTYLREQTNDK